MTEIQVVQRSRMPHVYQPRACVGQSPNNKRALSLKNVLVLDAFGSAGLNWKAEHEKERASNIQINSHPATSKGPAETFWRFRSFLRCRW